MARSAECKCESNLTCGYCLRNAKSWHYTLSDGSAIYGETAMAREQKQDVIRYVVTYVNKDGMRTLFGAAQGRNTYETAEAAEEYIGHIRRNNNAKLLAVLFGSPDTLEVRPVLCYWHHDPKGIWFD